MATVRQRVLAVGGKAAALAEPLRNGPIRRLWAAQLTSEVGDWAARLALAVLVLERTHSPALVGLVTAASMVGWFGPGQLLTSLCERWPRRRVMLAADVVRGAAFLAVLLPMPTAALVVVVAAAGCATVPFEAARSALRPVLTPPELMGATVTVAQLTGDLSMLAGYLFGGVVLATVGATAALAVNAATFAVSALLTARLPRTEPDRELAPRRLAVATRVLAGTPLLRRAVGLVLVTQAGAVGVEALVAPYATEIVGRGGGWAAVLAAVSAVASLILTAALPMTGTHHQMLTRCAWLSAATGGATLVAFTLLPDWGGLIAFAAAGCMMVTLVPANVVVGPVLPDHIRSSAFSLLAGATVAVQAGGAVVAGLLGSVTGIRTAAALVAVPAALAGLYALARPVRLEQEEAEHPAHSPVPDIAPTLA